MKRTPNHPLAASHWDAFQTLYAKRERIWRLHCARRARLAAIADPRTGGDAGLIHNWGNEASKAVVARCDAQWRRLDIAIEGSGRDHLRAREIALGFAPIW